MACLQQQTSPCACDRIAKERLANPIRFTGTYKEPTGKLTRETRLPPCCSKKGQSADRWLTKRAWTGAAHLSALLFYSIVGRIQSCNDSAMLRRSVHITLTRETAKAWLEHCAMNEIGEATAECMETRVTSRSQATLSCFWRLYPTLRR